MRKYWFRLLRIFLSIIVAHGMGLGLGVAWGASTALGSESITSQIDTSDLVALQRGARLYMNYCSSCHSLKLMRYNSLAQGLGIVDESGAVLTEVVNQYLIFSDDKITSPVATALRLEDGQNWFGIAPPDLSLVARSRGANWLYAYLRSFYRDPNRPWGVNNLIFPDVAMPHVLWELQGIQELPKTEFCKMGRVIQPEDLVLTQAGQLSIPEYNQAIKDLVSFLVFVGEPMALKRKIIGVWVLLFLSIFVILAYLLKREYWKDIKK